MFRIQTLLIRILLFILIRIRNLLFILIWIRIMLFYLIRIRMFDTDPDPYHFKEVMYLKRYFVYIHLYLIFLVSRSNRTHTKVFLC
jgi:hypothetical protein